MWFPKFDTDGEWVTLTEIFVSSSSHYCLGFRFDRRWKRCTFVFYFNVIMAPVLVQSSKATTGGFYTSFSTVVVFSHTHIISTATSPLQASVYAGFRHRSRAAQGASVIQLVELNELNEKGRCTEVHDLISICRRCSPGVPLALHCCIRSG